MPLLTRRSAQVGTPERPLSDLGRVSYRSYWTRVLMPVLKERQGSISIKELSELTCIKPDDIIYTLQHLGLIQYQKGQHVLVAAPKLLDQHLREAGSAGLQVRRAGTSHARSARSNLHCRGPPRSCACPLPCMHALGAWYIFCLPFTCCVPSCRGIAALCLVLLLA